MDEVSSLPALPVKPSPVWLLSVSWVGRGQKPQCVVMTGYAPSEEQAQGTAVAAAKRHIGDKPPKGGVGVVAVELTPATLEEMLERSRAWYAENPNE